MIRLPITGAMHGQGKKKRPEATCSSFCGVLTVHKVEMATVYVPDAPSSWPDKSM